ncbi:hypothetical protein HYT05_02750, partial [Candidatus Kaiserbacteria bacterium]|nr:hypothetical protein [Candidatus Kaiserbacteria bacterium]
MSDRPRDYPRIEVRTKEWEPERCEEIGYGGEAAVYKIDSTLVAKIFHLPDSDTFETDADRKSAIERHRDMQVKLFALPEGLPEEVVVPTHLIENKHGRIIGYAMPFKAGMTLETYTKTTSMLSDGKILHLLGKLYDTIMALHQKGVVIGDLNESNVLVCGGTPYLIDVDSMQFGGFRSRAFTPRFTDPHLLEVQQTWISKSLFTWPAKVIGRILWVICRVTPPLRHRSFVWRLRLWGAKKPHAENI